VHYTSCRAPPVSSEPLPTSVYVHFPWCSRKCPYCDFATEPVKDRAIPHESYADAVLAELEGRAADLQGRRLFSVFVGGGTPSLWKPRELARVLAGILDAFSVKEPRVEVTVECNPTSLDQARAAAFREAGANRLSIGVQSLQDAHLAFLGRLHDGARARAAVNDALREVSRVSVDLMFGMPGQDPGVFDDDIQEMVDAGIEHVSTYALTIEPKTLFGSLHKAGKLRLSNDERYAELFELAQRRFSDLGWRHYEVSNFAVDGQESTHNQHYWRGGAYLGLGAAAVGCLDHGPGTARRWRNEPIPIRYLEAPLQEHETETLGPEEIVGEAVMLGLRTAEGLDLELTARRAGRDPVEGRTTAIAQAVARGDLVRDGNVLRVPRERWLKLDGIVRHLF